MGGIGHVNNVVYNKWAETARVNWAQNFAMKIDPGHRKEWEELWTPKGVGMILRKITTEYKFVCGTTGRLIGYADKIQPLNYPDRISVLHRLDRHPTATDSFTLEAVVLSEVHQRIAAKITEDIVVYNYRLGKKTPLQPFMLEAMRTLYNEQSLGVAYTDRKIDQVLRKLRTVEINTWDKEGASEDMGGSNVPSTGVSTAVSTLAQYGSEVTHDAHREKTGLEVEMEQLKALDDLGVSIDPDVGREGTFFETAINPSAIGDAQAERGTSQGAHDVRAGNKAHMKQMENSGELEAMFALPGSSQIGTRVPRLPHGIMKEASNKAKDDEATKEQVFDKVKGSQDTTKGASHRVVIRRGRVTPRHKPKSEQ